MSLRTTERRRKDGSSVRYLAFAENVWNAEAGRSEARVVYNFGRADAQSEARLRRRVRSINRFLGEETSKRDDDLGVPGIAIEESRELGVVPSPARSGTSTASPPRSESSAGCSSRPPTCSASTPI